MSFLFTNLSDTFEFHDAIETIKGLMRPGNPSVVFDNYFADLVSEQAREINFPVRRNYQRVYPRILESWVVENKGDLPKTICLLCTSVCHRRKHLSFVMRELYTSICWGGTSVNLFKCDVHNSVLETYTHDPIFESYASEYIIDILNERQEQLGFDTVDFLDTCNTSSVEFNYSVESGRDPIMRAGPSGPDVHYVSAQPLTAVHTQRAPSDYQTPKSQYRDITFMQDVVDKTTGKTDRHIQLEPFVISSGGMGHIIWYTDVIREMLSTPGTAESYTARNPSLTKMLDNNFWTCDSIEVVLISSGHQYLSGCARLRAIPYPYNASDIGASSITHDLCSLPACFAVNAPLLNFAEQNPVSLVWNWEGPFPFASTTNNKFIPLSPVSFMLVMQDPIGAGAGQTSELEVRPTVIFHGLRGAGDRYLNTEVSLQAAWATRHSATGSVVQSGLDDSPPQLAPTDFGAGETPIDTEAPAVDVATPVMSTHGIPSQVLIQDLIKRACHYFSYTGGFCSEKEGQLRYFLFPFAYYPQTFETATTNYGWRRMNALEMLAKTSFWASGSLRFTIYYTTGDGTNRTLSLYSRQHLNEFATVNNATAFNVKKNDLSPHVQTVNYSTDLYADHYFHSLTHNFPLEKRVTDVNPVLDVIVPNHSRFDVMGCNPPHNFEGDATLLPSWNAQRMFVPSTFLLRSEKPTLDVVLDRVVVMRAGTDTTKFGPLGMLPRIRAVPQDGAGQRFYALVRSEVPAIIYKTEGGTIPVVVHTAFNFCDGPIGGSLGFPLYPLKPVATMHVQSGKDKKSDPTLGEQISSVASTVGDVATGVSNAAKAVEPAVAAVTDIWDTVVPFISMLFDRPTAADTSESRWLRTNDNLSHVAGKIQAVTMDVDPQAKEDPASGMSYVDNHHCLLSTPGMIGEFVIPSNTASNTFLCAFPVTPMSVVRGAYSHNENTVYTWPTPLSILASNYQTFSGGLQYNFFVAKAPSETLVLTTLFHPGGLLDDVGPNMQLRGETHQIKENCMFSHIVNYQHPLARCMHNYPSRIDDPDGLGVIPIGAIGYLYVFLSQKITHTTLTKGSVHVFVTINGISDPNDPNYTRFYNPAPSPFLFESCGDVYPTAPSSRWVKDLTQDGDVEANPGPFFSGAASKITASVSAALEAPVNLNETLSKASTTADKLSDAADSFSSVAVSVDNVIKMIMEFFSKPMEWLIGSFSYKDMFNLAKDLYVAYRSDQTEIKCFSIVGVLVNLGIITVETSINLVFKLKDLVLSGLGFQSQTGDEEDAIPAKWFMMMVTAIAGTFSLKSVPKTMSFPKHLLTTFSDVFRSFNAFDIFIVKNLKALKAAWRWIVDKFYGTSLKDDLVVENIPDIKVWLGKVQTMSVLDIDRLKKDASAHEELLSILHDGGVLLKALATGDLSSRARGLQAVLMARYKLMYDMYVNVRPWIKLKNTAFVPFCIWISGTPGIGKSDIVSNMAVDICKALLIEHAGDPAYVVTPAAKHWDAFANEPIGVYDDPEQVKTEEAMSEFLSTFFKVLSPVPFVVPQAHLDAKNMLHKFMACIVTSNVVYPDTKNFLASTDAFYERRDAVLRFDLTADFKAFLAKHSLEWAGRQTFDTLNLRGLKYEGQIIDVYEMPNKRAGKEVYAGTWDKYWPKLLERIKTVMAARCKRAKDKQELFRSISPGWVERMVTSLEAGTAESVKKLFSDLHGINLPEQMRTQTGLDEVMNDVNRAFTDDSDMETVSLEDQDYQSVIDDVDIADSPLPPTPPRGVIKCVHDYWLRGLRAGTRTVTFLEEGFWATAERGKRYLFSVDLGTLAESHIEAVKPCEDTACSLTYKWIKDVRGCGADIPRTHAEWMRANLPMKVVTTVDHIVMAGWGLSKSIKIIGSILVALATTIAVVKALNWVLAPSAQSKSYDYAPMHKRGGAPKSNTSTMKFKRQTTQYPNLTIAVLDAVDKVGNRLESCRALAVGGFDYLVNRHFVEHMNKSEVNAIMYAWRTKTGALVEGECLWEKCDVVMKENEGAHDADIALLRIPTSQAHKSMTKAFASDNDHAGFSGEGVLVVDNRQSIVFRSVNCTRAQWRANDGKKQLTLDSYVYNFAGQGYCGTPLLDERSGRILGIHAFGNFAGRGGAVVINREMLEAMKAAFETTDVVDVEDLGGNPATLDGVLNEDFVDITTVQSGYLGSIPLGRTELKPSPVYGALGEPTKHPRRAPASDIAKAVNQYAGMSAPPDIADLAACEAYTTEIFIARAPPARANGPGVLTPQQVWCGIPGNPYYSAMQKNTSVGIPTRNVRGIKNKGSCIQIEKTKEGDQLIGYHKWYARRLASRLELLRAGTVPASFYHFFLKDECTKKDQSRGINGADVVDQQLFLQYFGDFFSAMDKANLKVSSAVTLDIERKGADLLAHLTELSGYDPEYQDYITGDYKGFGPTILREVLRVFGDVIYNWYECYEPDDDKKKENQKIRRLLWLSLCQSKHIVRDVVVTAAKGCPSGNPRTDKINTGCNLIYFELAWLSLARFFDPSMASLRCFDNNVRCAMYGDDVVATALVEWFNSRTLQQFFEQLGITYTDALKRPEVAPTDPLENMSFLKRTFVPHPFRTGVYLARLDKDVLPVMTSYTRGKNLQEQVENSLQTSIDACRFAYAWGPAFHKDVCDRLKTAWNAAGHVLAPPTWHEVDHAIWDSLPIDNENVKDPLVFY